MFNKGTVAARLDEVKVTASATTPVRQAFAIVADGLVVDISRDVSTIFIKLTNKSKKLLPVGLSLFPEKPGEPLKLANSVLGRDATRMHALARVPKTTHRMTVQVEWRRPRGQVERAAFPVDWN